MKEGWKYMKLGDVCDFISGFTPKKEELNSGSGIPYFKVSDMNRLSNSLYLTETELYVKNAKKIIPANSIVFPKNGGAIFTGKKRILAYDSIVDLNTEAIKINSDKVLLTYLFQYLLLVDFGQFDNGGGLPSLNIKKMKEQMIPIPPLSEQQRIVSYLDAQFAKIDQLKANAEKQLQAAKDLFQSALKELLTPKDGWVEKKLGEVAEIIRGKRFVRADIVEEGVPCIHYGDIYTHYGLSVTKTRGCVKPELAKKLRFAKKNDVIVVQAGENNWDIGVGVAYFGEEPAVVHDACFILRHKQNPMYISYYLRTYNYHLYLLDYVHEGKICSFLKPALENAPIALPPLAEQLQIVNKLDTISAKVKALQTNYTETITLCNDLKQALLKKVFEGEL